jgi:hypothetical protein
MWLADENAGRHLIYHDNYMSHHDWRNCWCARNRPLSQGTVDAFPVDFYQDDRYFH